MMIAPPNFTLPRSLTQGGTRNNDASREPLAAGKVSSITRSGFGYRIEIYGKTGLVGGAYYGIQNPDIPSIADVNNKKYTLAENGTGTVGTCLDLSYICAVVTNPHGQIPSAMSLPSSSTAKTPHREFNPKFPAGYRRSQRVGARSFGLPRMAPCIGPQRIMPL